MGIECSKQPKYQPSEGDGDHHENNIKTKKQKQKERKKKGDKRGSKSTEPVDDGRHGFEPRQQLSGGTHAGQEVTKVQGQRNKGKGEQETRGHQSRDQNWAEGDRSFRHPEDLIRQNEALKNELARRQNFEEEYKKRMHENERQEIEQIAREKEKECQRLREEMGKYKKDSHDLRKEIEKIAREKENDCQRLREEIGRYKKDSHDLRNRYTMLEKQLQEMQNQNDELKNRLSKLMSARLRDNNPNIADLSDENRPTKLGEKYSELYDNQWTDVFSVLTTEQDILPEETAVAFLKDILVECFELCKAKAQSQLKPLQEFFHQYYKSEQTERIKEIKDRRRQHYQIPEDLRKEFEKIIEKTKEKYMPQRSEKLSLVELDSYTQEVINLCWRTQVQDPPMALGYRYSSNATFDTTLFRAYTSSGPTIAFIVWPILLLSDDGAVMVKGVAQGKGKQNKVDHHGSVEPYLMTETKGADADSVRDVEPGRVDTALRPSPRQTKQHTERQVDTRTLANTPERAGKTHSGGGGVTESQSRSSAWPSSTNPNSTTMTGSSSYDGAYYTEESHLVMGVTQQPQVRSVNGGSKSEFMYTAAARTGQTSRHHSAILTTQTQQPPSGDAHSKPLQDQWVTSNDGPTKNPSTHHADQQKHINTIQVGSSKENHEQELISTHV